MNHDAPPMSTRCPWVRFASWRLILLATLLTWFALCATPPDISALTITGNFTGGTAPANARGGGNLVNIFNSAADVWEAAILDPWPVRINFSWAPLTGSTLGVHTLTGRGLPFGPVALPCFFLRAQCRETSGNIRFDNDGSIPFFLDPTPGTDREYAAFAATSSNLGGGLINTGRVLTDAVGNAVGRTDLFSVALHEIGHTLGLSSSLVAFSVENRDQDIDVIARRPFPGTTIPTISGAHLSIAAALMSPSIPPGIRRLAAGVDILADAEVSNFNRLNLDPRAPTPVPEPTSLLLFGTSAAIAWSVAARRKRRARTPGHGSAS